MKESALFEVQLKKLEGVCNENNLTFRFKRTQYPVQMTVRPLKDLDTQMSMLENVEESGFTSPEAYISFSYKEGGVTREYGGQFTITDTLQNKLERIFKKMCSFWLQHFFRDVMEQQLLSKSQMPYVADTPEELSDMDDPFENDDDEAEEE